MNGWGPSSLFLISMPGPWELILILFVLLLLFGAKRLPEIARGLGESIREFKKSFAASDDTDKKGSSQEKEIKPG